MKIIYNNVSSEYLYPLSKEDVVKLKQIIPEEDFNKIRTVEFGCNTKTTQEGRIVQKGRFYEIRINFCLKNFCTLLLSDDKKYIAQLNVFTKSIDQKTRLVTWKLADAKRYALFLLLHEIGHVVYSEHHSTYKLNVPTSKVEEQWCDNFAMQKIHELSGC